MAEGKREDEAGGLEGGRVLRSRSATERTERNKPDHLYSSPGPLSSIKAAFKRTSARSHSQRDGGREQRHPEIVLSVEPLPTTTWFSGASGVFPANSASQPVWDGGLHTSTQLPPSYEQVIKEKTQEKVVTPTAPPRRSKTSTAATQTDCVEEQTQIPQATDSTKRKPQKPQRPLQPKLFLVKAAGPAADRDTATDPDSAKTGNSLEILSGQSEIADTSSRPCPVPRPRSKPKQPDELPALVQLQTGDNADPVTSSLENETTSSGKYLKELLEAFDSDPQLDRSCPEKVQEDQNKQSQEDQRIENMSGLNGDIQARIRAFESQNNTNEASAPLPRPRNIYTKLPVVAPKPTVAPRPSISSKPPEKEDDYYEEVNITPMPPPPAPKPQLPRKPSIAFKEEPKPQPLNKMALLPPQPLLVRSKPVGSQDDEAIGPFKSPPLPPLKPSKELFNNVNNHNSTALLLNATQTLSTSDNNYVDSTISRTPIKPARAGSFSSLASSTQSVMRRPTVIRVPSTGSKSQNDVSDFPPPLPVQKAVGGLTLPPKLTNKEFFRSPTDPLLPPRPTAGKIAPPRPPPAKTAPGRPPPPQRDNFQQTYVHQEAPPRSSPQPLRQPSRKTQKTGPVLPPRPNPGHRLYNRYTLEIPHGIAEIDYNGTRADELSFQKNEVLALLNQIDSWTFKCQVGDAKGTVQKSHMKIITPLNSFSNTNKQSPFQEKSSNQTFGQFVENGTFEVQALYDFTPEGPGELGLRAGDVVTDVEQLDDEWYLGTCRGITGYFPINYAKPLNQSGPPASLPAHVSERKVQPTPETVRGPRCVARFDFEGEHSDELFFTEGDVIRLCEYLGDEWARGEFRGKEGIFPLNFVEVVEDLPPSAEQDYTNIPLSGMSASSSMQASLTPAQAKRHGGVEWVVALYDFTAEADDELQFVQGDTILVTEHLDSEWCTGRLNGREGIFPTAFVHSC